MKRLILIILAAGLIILSGASFAAGAIVVSDFVSAGAGEYEITYTCTADASGATFIATATTRPLYGYVYEVVTNPGSPSPTALYDITLTDSDGVDIMGGQLLNRSATVSESAVPKNDGVRCDRKVNSVLTINITNNSVNSAVIVVKVRFYLPAYR